MSFKRQTSFSWGREAASLWISTIIQATLHFDRTTELFKSVVTVTLFIPLTLQDLSLVSTSTTLRRTPKSGRVCCFMSGCLIWLAARVRLDFLPCMASFAAIWDWSHDEFLGTRTTSTFSKSLTSRLSAYESLVISHCTNPWCLWVLQSRHWFYIGGESGLWTISNSCVRFLNTLF